jgi:hypothetical protein
MPRVEFDTLPDNARVWIFASDRALAVDETRRILDATDAFLDGWAAHGVPLRGGRDLRYDRFLFVAVDEAAAGASGCSIDAMIRNLRALEDELGMTMVDHGAVLFRASEAISRVSRSEFSDLVRRGTVTPATVVFNNTVGTVGAVRSGRWETAAADSWHSGAFF